MHGEKMNFDQLFLSNSKLSGEFLVKTHPIFRRLGLKYTDQIIRASKVWKRFEAEQYELWFMPEDSLVIPIIGEGKIKTKTYQPGSFFMPRLKDKEKIECELLKEESTVIITLPFADYSAMNDSWHKNCKGDFLLTDIS